MTMQYYYDEIWHDEGTGPFAHIKHTNGKALPFEWREKPQEHQDSDPVSHPKHYTSHPSGIECIQITEHMGFCTGNAIKYIWRADLKDNAIEDLQKARWYIDKEISKRQAQGAK